MKKTAKTIISLLLLLCTVFTVMPSELAVNTSAAGGRLYGDINADGEISAADYVALRRHILKSKILDDGDMKYADVNRDGTINSADYIAIRLHILKIRLIEQPDGKAQPVVAYIPLDDRPVNVERIEYLAASAGITLLMPESPLFATRLDGQPQNSGGQIGDRKALLEWLKSVERKADIFVISLDQMLSGGLVGSRWLDNTDLTFEYEVADYIITLTKKKQVCLFDTVMRLASTTGFGGYGMNEYSALRSYAAAARKQLAGDALTVENIIAGYRTGSDGSIIPTSLPEKALTKYFSSRSRKLRLADYIFRNSGDDMFCFVGIDDSTPQISIQTNEINYITSLLGANGSLFTGTDELAMMCFSRLTTDRLGTLSVSTEYFGGAENQAADSFDVDSLAVCLEKHYDGMRLVRADDTGADLHVLVLTRPVTDNNAVNSQKLINAYKKYSADGKPVAIIDISGDPATLANRLIGSGADLGYVFGYSSWNTAANSIGISLSNAACRLAHLKYGEADTDENRAGFVRSVVFSFCKDIGYKHGAKSALDSYISSLGGNTLNYYSIVTPAVERNINAVFEKAMTASGGFCARIIKALEKSSLITENMRKTAFPKVALTGFRLPWYRTFEAAFDITVS